MADSSLKQRTIFTTILLLAFCMAVFAQVNKEFCPNIKIEASEIVNKDVEEFHIAAKNDEKNVKINTGNVGNSYRINVLAKSSDKKYKKLKMAKVIVFPNIDSLYIIDEYSNLDWKDEKPRLLNVVITMKQFKEAELFAYFEFDKKTSNAKKKSRLIKVFNFLSATGRIEKNRITFLISEAERERTYYELIPQKVSNSYFCDDCVIIRGEDLEKIVDIFEPKTVKNKKL